MAPDSQYDVTIQDQNRRARQGASSHAKLWAIIAVLVLVIAVLLYLYVIPTSHSISGDVSTSDCTTCTPPDWSGAQQLSVPSGSSVSFNWQTSSEFDLVTFDVWNAAQDTGFVCDSTGTSGSCSFTASSGAYTIFVEDSSNSEGGVLVTYSGSYSAPYL